MLPFPTNRRRPRVPAQVAHQDVELEVAHDGTDEAPAHAPAQAMNSMKRVIIHGCSLDRPPQTWQIAGHVATQAVFYLVLGTAIAVDVGAWRSGPLCTASTACSGSDVQSPLYAQCESLKADVRLMFFWYATAIAVGALKVLIVSMLLLCSTKSVESMMTCLPTMQRSTPREWRARYVVCAAWSLAVTADAWFVAVVAWRVIVLRMLDTWPLLICMIAATTIVLAFDAVMLYQSKRLCSTTNDSTL
jgi:hypothetical protein